MAIGSPFRYRKKERKRWRRRAKKNVMLAEKFEAEGVKLDFAAGSRRMAAVNASMALAKRRKKSKSEPK